MKHLAIASILFFTLLLLYGRVGEFDYAQVDDMEYVVSTEAVRAGLSPEGISWAFTSFRMHNWHPLTWISHMGDVSLFGLDPGPQHLVNAFLHGLNALLLYLLAFTLVKNIFSAFVVAFLFLVHPLHVESVAWIAERKDVLSGFFYLLSLYFYTRYIACRNPWRYGCVVLAVILALLSKPMSMTLPVAFLLLDFWPLHRISTRQDFLPLIIEKIPFFALSLAVGIITMAAQGSVIAPVDALSPAHRLMNSTVSYATYMRDMLVPVKLSFIYPLRPVNFVGSFLPSMAVLLATSVAAFVLRERRPWLLFGWLWFLLTLLPVIGLIQVGSQSHADRYMYLPSVGPLLALGASLSKFHGKSLQRLCAFLFPLFAFYAFLGWVQIGYWANPYMLFTRALDMAGEHYQSHAGLSAYYLDLGLMEEAESHAKAAIALHPDNPMGYANMGNVFFKKRDFPEAERFFRKALNIFPDYAVVWNNLGLTLEKQGRQEEAKKCFAAALKIEPGLAGVKENLSRLGG